MGGCWVVVVGSRGMLMGGHGHGGHGPWLCCMVVVAFFAIGICGQSFVVVGDHCGQLLLFVLIAVGSLLVLCVVGGGKRKKSHVTHDYQTRVICYVSQINKRIPEVFRFCPFCGTPFWGTFRCEFQNPLEWKTSE